MCKRVGALRPNKTELVSFPVPKFVSYLTDKSKEEFLAAADLSTHEKRMKSLMHQAPLFEAEMTEIYALCQWSPVYEFFKQNITGVKVRESEALGRVGA